MDIQLTTSTETTTNMATKKEPSMHISLGDDIRQILKPFAKNRGKSMSEIIRYSLEKLFEEEAVDPVKERYLKQVITKRFSIPKGYKLRSFWITLHTLADRYPQASSKRFWRELVYLSEIDKTHSQVVVEVLEDLKSAMAKNA